jgi:subtilisin family serine protease
MNSKQQQPDRNYGPVWISKRNEKTERLLSRSYRKDQILIFFKRKPTEKNIQVIKESFKKRGFKTDTIRISSCGNCDIPVQLWSAKGIHGQISGDSLKAGSGPASTTVGESYSLNFFNSLPADPQKRFEARPGKGDLPQRKKQEIVIAILDTGVDTNLVDPQYLWKENDKKTAAECYKHVHEGWNFVGNNGVYHDDNPGKHGSIVSQYIISQFKDVKENGVKIMPLKTHDKDGVGDLFGTICAINFAIAKGAQIINASWGFYYYYEMPIPYLKTLITGVLRKKGILFVTAAGNKIEADDVIARQIYQMEHGVVLTDDQLRDIAIHNFYPAHLSTGTNSVIAVTTTDGNTVASTQNYSRKFIDMGVLADQVSRAGMKFKLPFDTGADPQFISGSSFATAIASGIIGAYSKKSLYVSNIKKADFLSALQALPNDDGTGNVLENKIVLAKKHIKNGSCVK